MGGYNRVFLPVSDNEDDDDIMMDIPLDITTNRPLTEVYIVIHDREQSCGDVRYTNYQASGNKNALTKHTEIVSAHSQYEMAAESASKYVREFWHMDVEDEEWLELLDWQGDGWLDDEQGQASWQGIHRVHILAMQIH